MTITVVIPVLNEEQTLPHTLPHTLGLGFDEIIVVDGGSTDRTREIVAALCGTVRCCSPQARDASPPRSSPNLGVGKGRGVTRHGSTCSPSDSTELVAGRVPSRDPSPVTLLTSPPGRARQMNQGASVASSDVLLFLHADTRLPDDAKRAIQTALAEPSCIGGRFDVQFDRCSAWGSVISRLMNVRSRHTGIATGDQAIFVRTEVFRRLGGYEEIPVMEDVAFTRRLKRVGRLASLHTKVTTSYRRWERCGPLRTILLMWLLRFLYWLGVSPTRLARFYATVRE